MNTIRDLNASIVLLTETITLLQSSVNTTKQLPTPEHLTTNTATSPKTPAEVSASTSTNITATTVRNTDRNYNIVIYSVQESRQDSPGLN